MAEKFGLRRHRPEGNWVQTAPMTEVVGWQYRRRDVARFCKAVCKAERRGEIYGLRIERQPKNVHDANAIAVYGQASVQSLFRGSRLQEWHIGFVDRTLAAELVADLCERGLPIAAEMYSIYISNAGFHEIRFFVLAPPGWSVKKRWAARKSRDNQ